LEIRKRLAVQMESGMRQSHFEPQGPRLWLAQPKFISIDNSIALWVLEEVFAQTCFQSSSVAQLAYAKYAHRSKLQRVSWQKWCVCDQQLAIPSVQIE
jgi:hypothetical protein